MFYRSGWLRCVLVISREASWMFDPACFIGWECRVVQFDKYVFVFDVLSWCWVLVYVSCWFDVWCYMLYIIILYYILYLIHYTYIILSYTILFLLFFFPDLSSSSHLLFLLFQSFLSHSKYTCRVFHLLIYIPAVSNLSNNPHPSFPEF